MRASNRQYQTVYRCGGILLGLCIFMGAVILFFKSKPEIVGVHTVHGSSFILVRNLSSNFQHNIAWWEANQY